MRNEGSREDGNYSDYAWDRDDGCPFLLILPPFCIITINVPVVYMALYVMVLRQARSITRGIGRGGPRLFWALNDYELSECHFIGGTVLVPPLLMVQTHASNKKKC
jgi:hypothetical protein